MCVALHVVPRRKDFETVSHPHGVAATRTHRDRELQRCSIEYQQRNRELQKCNIEYCGFRVSRVIKKRG